MTLPQALVYADRAKAAYKDALGNQAQLSSWLGIGLIPVAAFATGLAVTGSSSKAVVETTLTGVAGYGVGTWLYSKPYQRAWVTGYNATCCAISAVIPLAYVDDRKADIKANIDLYDASRQEVFEKADALETKIRAAVGQGVVKTTDEVVLRANKRIQDVKELVNSADVTRTNALKMLGKADTAGLELKEAVDRIAGQVSGLLVDVAPDIQALSSIIGGLAQSYRTFASVPEALKPPAKVQAQGAQPQLKPIIDALSDLDLAVRNLMTAQQKLSDDVALVANTTPFETLRACGVSAEQVSVPLSLDPPGPVTFEAGKAATKAELIRGGAAPFSVVLQANLTDLVVQQTEAFGPVFKVQVSDKTPVGQVPVLVSDRSGNKLLITVAIEAKTPGPEAPKAPDGGTGTPAQAVLTKAVKALKGVSGAIDQNVSFFVDNVEMAEGGNKLNVDVSLKKGAKLLTVDEAKSIADATIIRAILSQSAASGLSADQIQIRNRKPAGKTG
jgi:hypothetical protein